MLITQDFVQNPFNPSNFIFVCHLSHIYKGSSLLIDHVWKAVDSRILKYFMCPCKKKPIHNTMDPFSLKPSLMYQICSVKFKFNYIQRFRRKSRIYRCTQIHSDEKRKLLYFKSHKKRDVFTNQKQTTHLIQKIIKYFKKSLANLNNFELFL